MKNRTLAALLLLAFVPMLLVSCTEEVKPVEVNDSLLIGKWQKETNMQEYWRYDADSTGETWDESEDVQEGEGIKFNWSTEEDQLRLDFYGCGAFHGTLFQLHQGGRPRRSSRSVDDEHQHQASRLGGFHRRQDDPRPHHQRQCLGAPHR